ncbi:MAG: lysylphosphatidylglycerol synthase transmembrane domain-containing protein [Acidobacteriota bacterium]|nr:lysylphosphatidylglycerol synthase transmembrane domain-containing protein [Acidobacteriota bacterium]
MTEAPPEERSPALPTKTRRIRRRQQLTALGSWLLGLALLVAVAMAGDFSREQVLQVLSPLAVAGWILVTLLARLLQVEILVRPIYAWGGTLGRSDAFWLGWLRSFFNQVVPLSGLAVYAGVIKRRSGLAWGQVAALASPQFLLALLASSLFGAVMVSTNLERLGNTGLPLLAAFLGVGILVAVLIARGGHGLSFAPAFIRQRLETAREAWILFSRRHDMLWGLLVLHILSTLFRATRLWILFAASGADLPVALILLLIAVSDFSFLLQITPGGLGIKEAALVGIAAFLGIDTQITAAVALADRVLILSITTLLAGPGFWALRRAATPAGPRSPDS